MAAVHSNYNGGAARAGKEDCPDNVFIVRGIDFSPLFSAQHRKFIVQKVFLSLK